jgi:hypothetical protein
MEGFQALLFYDFRRRMVFACSPGQIRVGPPNAAALNNEAFGLDYSFFILERG